MAHPDSASVEDGSEPHRRPAADHAHKSETDSETRADTATDGGAADLGLFSSAAIVCFCITPKVERRRTDSASGTATG